MDAKTSGDPLGCPIKKPAALRSLLGRTNRDWWPNQLSLEILQQNGLSGDPMDQQPALVAGGLRTLRAFLHPYGVAQRRHLSHR
jgi:catalase (peroxidase I)